MSANPHAGLPIADDDATIAAALEDLSVPTLMLSLVHPTGDPKWIRGDIKPQGLFLNEVQGFMPEAYVPMMLEEMELGGRDARVIDWADATAEARADFPVVLSGRVAPPAR